MTPGIGTGFVVGIGVGLVGIKLTAGVVIVLTVGKGMRLSTVQVNQLHRNHLPDSGADWRGAAYGVRGARVTMPDTFIVRPPVTEIRPLVASTGANVRPTLAKTTADGAAA
jgi:hypothetical protein